MTAIVALAEELAVCRLSADAAVPSWATRRAFFSITRTGEELSVVCPDSQVPHDVRADHGWRALKLMGPFDLSTVGVLLAVAAPLAAASVPILPVATFDTDYVLVKQDALPSALRALALAGHDVREDAR